MSVTLQDLITDIDDRYSNSFTDAQKIRWINTSLLDVYTYIAVDKISEVTTTADTAMYAFPDGCEAENVESMTISLSAETDDNEVAQRSLKPLNLNDPIEQYSWVVPKDGYFIVYPTPTATGQVIRIYHQVKPTTYTESDLATADLEDELNSDYFEAVKLHVLFIMCEANDDIMKANNYAFRYNEELKKLKHYEYKKAGKYPTTRDVMKMANRSYRTRGYQVRGRRRSNVFFYY